MTWMDRWIQKQRINRVLPYIPANSTVLDIGCHHGELFEAMGDRLRLGFGLDPQLPENIKRRNFTLFQGGFPDDWNMNMKMDCITLLAVLEHIQVKNQQLTILRIFESLVPDGIMILTVPSKKADRILKMLNRIGIIHGMSLEEHFGFDPENTKMLFEKAGFTLIKHKKFQFQFNNLFVFKKTA
jgi:cyclopropane fatty-acyl-phospholipid synthase-like methyltransferase